VRKRDAEGAVTADPPNVAVVAGNRSAQSLFWRFSIVGVPWHRGLCQMRRMVLCLSPGRSGQGLDVFFGPYTANGNNETAFDGRIPTEANESSLLHVQGIDSPTLSPECQEPSNRFRNRATTTSGWPAAAATRYPDEREDGHRLSVK